MKINETSLSGLYTITPKLNEDSRGYFFESFRSNSFETNLVPNNFVQENQSLSKKGTLRGLHYQLKYPQGKLVWVAKGAVIDIAVDIRKDSPTFGKSFSTTLDDKKHMRLYISPGFAHGFFVLSDYAIFQYKCTEYYHPEDEYGIHWNDKSLKIDLGDAEKFLSEKDISLPKLNEIDSSLLPILN